MLETPEDYTEPKNQIVNFSEFQAYASILKTALYPNCIIKFNFKTRSKGGVLIYLPPNFLIINAT